MTVSTRTYVILPFLLLLFPVAAGSAPHPVLRTLTVSEASFGDGPETAVKVASLYGDSERRGMFIEWMKMPAGAETPPHWHTSDEIFTVISGSIGLGIGDKLDKSTGKIIEAGGFAVIPAKAHHFGWSENGAVIQVQGLGPFHMNWLKPAKE